jgi:uncharacterized repeat protein (TIGR03803 family)
MKNTKQLARCFIILCAAIGFSGIAGAQTNFSLLHSFAGGTGDGENPYGGLISAGSALYGMTYEGGSDDMGTVFSIGTNGTGFSLLHSFAGGGSDGGYPCNDLARNGATLYGVTSEGIDDDHDVLFSLQTNGSNYTTLYDFNDSGNNGYYPYTSPLLLSGVLYGMTYAGGSDDDGVLYSIQTNGISYTNLHEFEGALNDGSEPELNDLLMYGSRLYGMTKSGGINNDGTLFSVKPDGSDFKILHNFNDTADDGATPKSSLTAAGDTLYGTTSGGGPNRAGTVFSIHTNGTDFALLKSFAYYKDGTTPEYVKLVSDGTQLYGTTKSGGLADRGTIFSVKPDGSEFAILHSFHGDTNDGYQPYGGVIVTNGMLYGMTYYGGTNSSYGEGVIYSLSTDGDNYKMLHAFAGDPDDGENPYAELIMLNDKLYGMTQYGGINDRGTVFCIDTNGANMTLLHSFSDATSDGRFPHGGLIETGGTLYGMTQSGGANTGGAIFSLHPDGSGFNLLHSFGSGTDGEYPYRDLLFTGGKLYGMTQSGGENHYGIIFSVQTNGTSYTNLHAFQGGTADGRYPYGNLATDDAGTTLYGMTRDGGTTGDGIVFSIKSDGTNYTNLHSCVGNEDGAYSPKGTPVLQNGRLYALASGGSTEESGALFSINTNGTDLAVAHTFTKQSDGARYPVGRLAKNGNTLYGMLKDGGSGNDGAVFAIKTDGTSINYLHDFTGSPSDGSNPRGSLMMTNDNLYGMTYSGGTNDKGIIFKINIKGATYPDVTITTPAQTVNYGISSIALTGTNTEDAVGSMTVSNAANGEVYVFAESQEWTAPSVMLTIGDNIITVSVTNQIGYIGKDSVTITRTAKQAGDTDLVYYAATNGANITPYTTWNNAATCIQDAVDTAAAGDTIIVSNGVYNSGGRTVGSYSLTNRVAIEKAITIKSVNGAEHTSIIGAGPRGSNAVRCVYMTAGSSLSGFTLSGGYTLTAGSDDFEQGGGGALLDQGGTITNCIITDCEAQLSGGGVYAYYGGEVINSELKNNIVYRQGGGVRLEHGGLVDRCHIHDNLAYNYDGGGVFVHEEGLVRNSLIENNDAHSGAGVYLASNDGDGPRLYNCTVTENISTLDGGGVRCYSGGKVRNSIVYYNTSNGSGKEDNFQNDGLFISYDHTCITPAVTGTGNITNTPLFIDAGGGNYHLATNSLCIDAGTNLTAITADLDGTIRPLDGDADSTAATDMGCYERLNRSADSDGDTMPDGWEDDHGLNPIDPSDQTDNPDGDSFNNLQEYIADTDPTNSSSYFCVAALTNLPPVTLYFNASTNRRYTMQGCTNLVGNSWTNIPGAGPRKGRGSADSMNDTNQPPKGPFYRLEVELVP